MSNYKNLFEELLSNFLNDDFIENAQKLFNEQKKECKCKKEEQPVSCRPLTFKCESKVKSEVLKTNNSGLLFKTFLPNLKKEDIRVVVDENDNLSITLPNVPKCDFFDSSYSKTIKLGDAYDYSGITATYEHNVFSVYVPYAKKENKQFEIKIN